MKNNEKPFVDKFDDTNMNEHRHILNDPKVELDQIQWETHLRKYVKDKQGRYLDAHKVKYQMGKKLADQKIKSKREMRNRQIL